MESYNQEEMEIDIRELASVLFKKAWIIISVGLICALSAGILTKLVLHPIYTSATTIYVINRQDKEEATTYNDLQTGSLLTKDYQILVKSRLVTEQVITNLDLDMTSEELTSLITVNVPADSRIIEIKVNYSDPIEAKAIADSVAEVSAEKMVSIMEMEKANIVEKGSLPIRPSSPNMKKNILLGGIAGTFLAAILILVLYMMDDSIISGDDIERYLGLTLLGSIPLEESAIHSRKVKRELKRAYKKGYKGGCANNAVYKV